MPITNDSDIKIFRMSPKNDDDMSEEMRIAEGIKAQRKNGNSSKAKKLGIKLAGSVIDSVHPKVNVEKMMDKVEIEDEYEYQANALAVFTAESCLEAYMPSQFLTATAINSLYDSLMEQNNEFYEKLSDGAEFSFYYLCLRRGGDVPLSIGKAFAMLCNKEDDKEFCERGTELYNLIFSRTKELIEKVKFA